MALTIPIGGSLHAPRRVTAALVASVAFVTLMALVAVLPATHVALDVAASYTTDGDSFWVSDDVPKALLVCALLVQFAALSRAPLARRRTQVASATRRVGPRRLRVTHRAIRPPRRLVGGSRGDDEPYEPMTAPRSNSRVPGPRHSPMRLGTVVFRLQRGGSGHTLTAREGVR